MCKDMHKRMCNLKFKARLDFCIPSGIDHKHSIALVKTDVPVHICLAWSDLCISVFCKIQSFTLQDLLASTKLCVPWLNYFLLACASLGFLYQGYASVP